MNESGYKLYCELGGNFRNTVKRRMEYGGKEDTLKRVI